MDNVLKILITNRIKQLGKKIVLQAISSSGSINEVLFHQPQSKGCGNAARDSQILFIIS